MTLDFLPSSEYPTNTVTDGQFLYRSLGSFWTQLFYEKEALKGYTLGMADELIQAYYNLTETVRQYSVKEIDLLHKERWKELVIKKSEFNAISIQAGDGLVFGQQPATDTLYSSKIFRVGFPKESDAAYSFKPPYSVKKFGALANRILAPSLLLLPGVDVIVNDDLLLFNSNLFADTRIPRAKLVTDDGRQATYTDSAGNVLDDEFIVLWVYNVEQDNQELYKNFGVLLDINLPTSQSYKELLKAIMNLSVEGPTVAALNKAFAALLDVPVIIEPLETVEDVYDLGEYTYVITDKNVYRAPVSYTLASNINIGATLYAGDILTGNVKLYDPVIHPSWWKTEIRSSKLGFASHVFAANATHQLFFENTASVITYQKTATLDRIIFPVVGDTIDVAAFQAYINLPDNKRQILAALNIDATKDLQTVTTAVNPLDFMFSNLFKNNTLFVRLYFYSNAQLNLFFSLLGELQPYLPPHVYLLMYINMELPSDVISNLNSCVTIPAFGSAKFCADGSTSTGARPGTFDDGFYYKDYTNRLFSIAKGPLKSSLPLYAASNLDELSADNTLTPQGNSGVGIRCGLLRTDIPGIKVYPGESVARGPTNREVPTILLIDF